jgi:signal transduction histidine kinase
LGRTRGLGLIEMHERAALAGTRLEVRSLIGAGTEVRMMLAQRAGARAG